MLEFDNRPWGRWEEYLNEPGYRVKRLVVLPNKRLSLQRHRYRAEHWVVVHGTGVLTVDDAQITLMPGVSAFIPQGAVHRVESSPDSYLVIIETQLGLCIESDIERLADDFGRA